jgi:hypothetical protein
MCESMGARLTRGRLECPCDTLGSPKPHRRDAKGSEPKPLPLEIEIRTPDETVRTQLHVAEFDIVGAGLRHPNGLPDTGKWPYARSIKWNEEEHRAVTNRCSYERMREHGGARAPSTNARQAPSLRCSRRANAIQRARGPDAKACPSSRRFSSCFVQDRERVGVAFR